MKKKPTIAIFTSTEGHFSISTAIEQALEKKYNLVRFYERDSLFDVYTPIYQLFPGANALPFTMSKNPRAQKVINQFLYGRYQKKIEDFVAEHKPDLCISTYFMYSPNLESVKRIAGVPFINVVADPWTFHPLFVSDIADVNLMFDQHSLDLCRKSHPKANYDISGWFVREPFAKPYSQTAVRKKLGLETKPLTLLIASGSEGTSMIMKIIPAIIFTPQKVQIIVACGNNQSLLKSVNAFRSMLTRIGNENSILALGFTHELHKYMQAADLVIGKAGPNSLFETTATKTPFFAITHISGQEDGNLEIIEEYKLGFVEERLLKAQSLLKKIIADASMLDQFDQPIAKMADHNNKAADILHKHIARLLK